MPYINHNLKFYRLNQRYTQQEIANKLKTSLGKIKTYESDTTPPVETIIKIAEMMQISIDTLIKTKLSDKNYIHQKDHTPDLVSRVEALEQKLSSNTVNKTVNKIQKK